MVDQVELITKLLKNNDEVMEVLEPAYDKWVAAIMEPASDVKDSADFALVKVAIDMAHKDFEAKLRNMREKAMRRITDKLVKDLKDIIQS